MTSCCNLAAATVVGWDKSADAESLVSDWEQAIKMWDDDHSTFCFIRDQMEEKAREAAWQQQKEERERLEKKTQRLDSDIDSWSRQQRREEAEEAAREAEAAAAAKQKELSQKATSSSANSSNCHSRPVVHSLVEVDEVSRSDIPVAAYGSYVTALQRLQNDDLPAAITQLNDVVEQCVANRVPATLYGARAACHLKRGNFHSCLKDSLQSTQIDAMYTAGYARAARCYIILGNIPEAKNCLSIIDVRGLPYDTSKELWAIETLQKHQKLLGSGKYEEALRRINEVCSAIPEAPLEVKRIETLSKLRPEEALADIRTLHDLYPADADILYWRAHLQYQCSTDSLSYVSLQQYLLKAINSTITEHIKAKQLLQLVKQIESRRQLATSFSSTRRWKQALQEYNNLLMMSLCNDRLEVLFLMLRAGVHLRMGNSNGCVIDCTAGLNKQLPQHRAALYSLRVEGYLGMGRYDDALHDAREEHKLNPTTATEEKMQSIQRQRDAARGQYFADEDTQRAYSSANNGSSSHNKQQQHQRGGNYNHRQKQQQQHQQKPKPVHTHYDTLGAPLFAAPPVVAKAFKKEALKWHPDKWAGRSDNEKLAAEERFKAINHAYSVLSDAVARKNYDATL